MRGMLDACRALVVFVFVFVFAALAACGPPEPAASPAVPSPGAAASATPGAKDKLGVALDGPQRSDESRARDVHRHPRETLELFGLRDDMTVVELWPGGGWYTEILAPYLHDKGKLTITGSRTVYDRIQSEPKYFGKVEIRRVEPPTDLALGPDGSADLVLTFRNVHNWMSAGYTDKVFAAAFKVLKPGGTLGVVEHRAKRGTDPKVSADTGYVTEDVVIGFATHAGFVLDARSEINANPKDTADHKGGVWALPPSFVNGDTDRAKYAAIGESDRMTLRFKKR